jgi:hypothetical protein
VKRNFNAIGWQHVKLQGGTGMRDGIDAFRGLPLLRDFISTIAKRRIGGSSATTEIRLILPHEHAPP